MALCEAFDHILPVFCKRLFKSGITLCSICLPFLKRAAQKGASAGERIAFAHN